MSDASRPDDVPSEAELDKVAVPGFVRNAPRYGRILGTGIAFGVAIGFGLGFGLPGEGIQHRTTVIVLLCLGGAIIGGVVAGTIAAAIDGADPARRKKTD